MDDATETPHKSPSDPSEHMPEVLLSCGGDSVSVFSLDSIKRSLLDEVASVKTFQQTDELVTQAKLLRNGAKLALATSSGRLLLSPYDFAVQQSDNLFPDFALLESPYPIVDFASSPSEKYLVSGDESGAVAVHDLRRKTVVQRYQDHNDECTSVTFVRDDRHLATSGRDGKILLYSISQEQVSSCLVHCSQNNSVPMAVNQIRNSPLRKNYLASCGDDGHLMLWDVLSRGKTPLRDFAMQEHTNSMSPPCNAMVFSPSSDKVAYAAGFDSTLSILDLTSSQVVRRVRVGSPVCAMDISKDGRYIALGHEDGSLQILATAKLSSPMCLQPGVHSAAVGNVCFSNARTNLEPFIREEQYQHSDKFSDRYSVCSSSDNHSLATSTNLDSGVLATLDLLSETNSYHSHSVFDRPSTSIHESIHGSIHESTPAKRLSISNKSIHRETNEEEEEEVATEETDKVDTPPKRHASEKELMLDISSFTDFPSRDTKFNSTSAAPVSAVSQTERVKQISSTTVPSANAVIEAMHEISNSLRSDIRLMQRDFMDQFAGMRDEHREEVKILKESLHETSAQKDLYQKKYEELRIETSKLREKVKLLESQMRMDRWGS